MARISLQDQIAAAVAAAFATQQGVKVVPTAPAVPQQAAKAAPQLAALDSVFALHQIGQPYKSAKGNTMVAVRGKTSDGRQIGGNLWIK